MSEIAFATIVGGGGFIGSHLARELEGKGIACWIPHRDDPELFRRDLGTVFYCAGVNAGSARKVFDSQWVHVGHVAELLDRAAFASFLYLSSTRVYMDSPRGDEDAPLVVAPGNPDHLFNVTKLAGESVCLNDPRAGVRVARVSNVFGGGARSETFLASIVFEAVRDRRVVLRTALDTGKDYIGIEDCVAALLEIACRGTERLYNVASGSNVLHAQITTLLARRTGAVIEVAPGAPTIAYPEIDVRRLRALLPGPPRGVLESLDALVRSYEETA